MNTRLMRISGSNITMSASYPLAIFPFLFAMPIISAGVSVIMRTASSRGRSPIRYIFRTNRSAVATLPAKDWPNQAEQRHAFSGHPKHKHCPEQQHSIHRPFSNYRKIPITQENGQIENACSASGNAQEKVGIFLFRNPVKSRSGNACSDDEQPDHLQDTGQKCISNENRCKDENRSKNSHNNSSELLLGIHSLRWRNRLHGLCL